jgi:23S rRNA (cytosine1962-C5)-methyltransferase
MKKTLINNTKTLIADSQPDYELISTGQNYKLERYGSVVLARPDPQALWPANMNSAEWQVADATFKKTADGDDRGEWNIKKGSKINQDSAGSQEQLAIDSKWSIEYGGLNMQIKLSPFKHTGLFPEQIINWQWMEKIISSAVTSAVGTGNKPKILNLFGYTGGASLICAKSGAEVTHVDASKSAITWANENAKLSGLEDKPIRWILEDAGEFVKRELRRGNKYDAIIMDPPAFGRGAKGEIWKIEDDFLPFIENCLKLLSDKPLFVVLNGYSAGYSSIAYARNLTPLIEKFGGEIEHGELCIAESAKPALNPNLNLDSDTDSGPRLLPCGIVARWKAV